MRGMTTTMRYDVIIIGTAPAAEPWRTGSPPVASASFYSSAGHFLPRERENWEPGPSQAGSWPR
jgi:hypothetical protein